jgi:hypothetical protein
MAKANCPTRTASLSAICTTGKSLASIFDHRDVGFLVSANYFRREFAAVF